MKNLTSLIIILSLCLSGCGRVSESALKDVLEKDPLFEKTLDEKRKIDAKILVLKNNYSAEKDMIIQKIRALKGDLKVKRNSLNSQNSSLKSQLDPKIHTLMATLQKTHAEYKSKIKDFKILLAKLKNMKKVLYKKGDLSLSGDEVSVWNKRIGDLEKEIASLQKALDKLRTKARLLKTEINILKE